MLKKCFGQIRSVVTTRKTQNGIGYIIMNSPPVNILTLELFRKITEAVNIFQSDPNCHAIVLGSSVRVYSAGLDLNVLVSSSDKLIEYWREYIRAERSLLNCRVPTISAMNGHSIAGGCILSMCCDLRVIHSSGKIGLNEITFGINAPPIAEHLIRNIVGTNVGNDALSQGTIFTSGMYDDFDIVVLLIGSCFCRSSIENQSCRRSVSS
jgi:3,2-trans-enoyl-CoA isomerase